MVDLEKVGETEIPVEGRFVPHELWDQTDLYFFLQPCIVKEEGQVLEKEALLPKCT